MTASFPWYDLPSVQWANDAIWRAAGLGGCLDRATPIDAQWRSADLIVSQACGLDLFLSDAPIKPVLAPVFDLDCEAGCYYSHLVGRRQGVAAVNSLTSRSGLSALLTVCEPTALLVTGSHQASLATVRDGSADMACIDAVTWNILARDAPEQVRDVPVLARTCSAPAPPYVVPRTASEDDATAPIKAAMASAATLRARRALFIRGVVPVAVKDYAAVLKEYNAIQHRIPSEVMWRVPRKDQRGRHLNFPQRGRA